jgi:hypothetical protein
MSRFHKNGQNDPSGASEDYAMLHTENPLEELEQLELEEANAHGVSVEMLRTFKDYLRVSRAWALKRGIRPEPDGMLLAALERGADPEAWIDWLVGRLIDVERMMQGVDR